MTYNVEPRKEERERERERKGRKGGRAFPSNVFRPTELGNEPRQKPRGSREREKKADVGTILLVSG
jgi:hypothetical protein